MISKIKEVSCITLAVVSAVSIGMLTTKACNTLNGINGTINKIDRVIEDNRHGINKIIDNSAQISSNINLRSKESLLSVAFKGVCTDKDNTDKGNGTKGMTYLDQCLWDAEA